MPMNKYIGTKDVARLTGLTIEEVYDLIHKGTLPAHKALDAIVLHNYLFPETAMKVVGFTRDSDNLFRIILTQPYVNCLRLHTSPLYMADLAAAREEFLRLSGQSKEK